MDDDTCPACMAEVQADAPTFAHTNADITFAPDTLVAAKLALRDRMAHLKTARPSILAQHAPDPPDDVDIPSADMPGIELACGHKYHIRCIYKFMLKSWNARHNACMVCNHRICEPHPDPPGMPDGPPPPMYNEIRNLERDAEFVSPPRNSAETFFGRLARRVTRDANADSREHRRYRDAVKGRYTRAVTDHVNFQDRATGDGLYQNVTFESDTGGPTVRFGVTRHTSDGLERRRRSRGGGGVPCWTWVRENAQTVGITSICIATIATTIVGGA